MQKRQFEYVPLEQPVTLSSTRQRFGATAGSPAYYAYVQLCEQYPTFADGGIPEAMQCELESLLKKVHVVRAFELAGYDMSREWKEREQYRVFGERFGKKFTRANLQRNYVRYAKPLFERVAPHQITGHHVTVAEMKQAIEEVGGACEAFHTHVIYQILQAYDAADDVLAYVEPSHNNDKTYYNSLYQEYTNDVKDSTIDSKPYTLKEFRMLVDQLYDINGTLDAATMTVEQGLAFCKYLDGRYGWVLKRIPFLQMFGFAHTASVLSKQKHGERMQKVYEEIVSHLPQKQTFHVFTRIMQSFEGDIADLGEMRADQICKVIQQCQTHKPCFDVVRYWLTHVDAKPALLAEVIRALPPVMTGKSTFSVCASKSEWRAAFLASVMDEYKNTSTNRSAYVDANLRKIQGALTRFLHFLEPYVLETWGTHDAIKHIDPIRWFLTMATADMYKKALIAYGCSLRVDNTRVKSAQDVHHAKRAISFCIGFFKKESVRTLLACRSDIANVTPNDITIHVPNLRVPADTSKRRYLNEEETKAFLQQAQDNPTLLLMVVLLCEVALRIGALVSLRYGDLITTHHTPRQQTRVMEKGKRYREFMLSSNLQRAILLFINRCRCDDPDAYLFHAPDNIHKPVSQGWVRATLKQLAAKAGIAEVAVTPHMFRHTLVHKLMQLGNSGHLVSKFMGHASVDTTMNSYWVDTTEDIFENMVTAKTDSHVEENLQLREMQEEIEDLHERLQRAREIVDTVNVEIANLHHEPAVRLLSENILRQIPDMLILLNSLESTTGTTISRSTTTMSRADSGVSSYYSESDAEKDLLE